MRHYAVLSLAAMLLALPTTASAANTQLRIGGDGAFVLPIGDWADVSSVGLGALFKIEYEGLAPNLALTGRIGYIFHFESNNVNTNELPILGGAKYYFTQGKDRFYGAAELGFVNLNVDTDFGSDSDLKLGLTLGGGYEMGPLDIRGQFFMPSIGDIGDFFGLMVTVGYAVPIG